MLHKGATRNPKIKNDDKYLRWSSISTLNSSEIMKKEFENIFKNIKHEDKDFLLHKRDWEILNKIMNQLLLISYFYQKIVKK